MAMKKTGLGKGLDALFSTGPLEEDKEEEKVVEKVDESEKIHKIKITEIEPNKNQPRRTFNNESIELVKENSDKDKVIQLIESINLDEISPKEAYMLLVKLKELISE